MAQVILYVDDSEQRLHSRSAILRGAGFQVVEARDTGQALALIRQHHPAVAVLDVQRPDPDGFALCREIKGDADTASTLVLHALAAGTGAALRVKALESGVDCHLVGPVEPEELIASVRSLLRLADAEARARGAAEAFRRLADNAPDMVGRVDREYRFVYVNPAWEQVGVHPDDLRGKQAVPQWPQEGVAFWQSQFERVFRMGQPLSFEVQSTAAPNRPLLELKLVPEFAADGSVETVLALSRDITARKRAEETLRVALAAAERHEAEIQSIYDSAPIGLCVIDREGRYLRVNRRLAEMNGTTPEANVGRTLHEVVPGVAEQAQRLLDHIVETGRPGHGIEVRGERPDQPGVIGTWIQNWVPLRDGDGTVVGVNVGVEDVTRLKQVEEELREANRVKDQFLATLSHELRTPLTAILGWSHLMERAELDEPTRRQAVQAIARNAEAQRQLITEVLDMSRMLAGKLRLELEDVDVMSVIALAVEALQPACDAKGVHLMVSAVVSPALVRADPGRLRQVVLNLLSNAVKFTPTGGRIVVEVRRADATVDIVVADTGIGIPPEFLGRVFDRFAQADSSMSRRHSGLGLGLSIVRQLVELHGGTVRVASDGEGQGAVFTVSLPVRGEGRAEPLAVATTAVDHGADSRVDLRGLRVLVVDDMEDARSLVGTVIRRAGGEVGLAASGEDALSELAAARPDLILADLGMPGMDGYELLRRVRSLPPAAGGNVPVAALTAYGRGEDRATALAAGFAAHLTKPVLPDELLRLVDRIARGGA